MTWIRRIMTATLALVAASALIMFFRQNRDADAVEDEGEAPIVAPSRIEVENGEPVVVLDSADIANVGLQLDELRPVTRRPEDPVPGEVVDEPERVSTVRAPVTGRLQAEHWPGYGDRVASGAELGQVSDARPLVAPAAGTVTEVGAHPGDLVQAGQLLLRIIDYSRPVVRIAWSNSGARPPATIRVVPEGSASIPARLMGPAPTADPATRQPVFLYRADRSWPGARPGVALTAFVPRDAAPLRGVLVPEAAAVQWDGLVWVYRARGDGRFGRVRVPVDHPVPGGWMAAAAALEAGDTIVVVGAEQLLSEEFRSRVSVGEESGE